MRTTFKVDGTPVACGSIDPLPGSSQVAVFHSAFVLYPYRGHSVGTQAHQQRIKEAKEALFDYAVVTVDAANAHQIRILEANRWQKLDAFVSSKTQHLVLIYGRRL